MTWLQDHVDAEGFKCWTYYPPGPKHIHETIFGHVDEMETGWYWHVGYCFDTGGVVESGSMGIKSEAALKMAQELAEKAYERLLVK